MLNELEYNHELRDKYSKFPSSDVFYTELVY